MNCGTSLMLLVTCFLECSNELDMTMVTFALHLKINLECALGCTLFSFTSKSKTNNYQYLIKQCSLTSSSHTLQEHKKLH